MKYCQSYENSDNATLLFPYISYFHLIKSVEKFVIFDDVNYIKKGWINRNNFLDLGDVKLLTFQLDSASQNKKINEIRVGTGAKKYLMNIQRMYQKAPYFDNVFPIISNIIQSDEKQLALFVEFLNDFIGISIIKY